VEHRHHAGIIRRDAVDGRLGCGPRVELRETRAAVATEPANAAGARYAVTRQLGQ
jgi:hypothetical protein